MNVLLFGGGGREHALAWKLRQSPQLGTLYCAPGNPGIAEVADCITLDVNDHAAVIDFCRTNAIDLVIIGPEAPLVAGIADDLAAAEIAVFGPSRAAARLEGSKAFTKQFCATHGIPTAGYAWSNNRAEALAYARSHPLPLVIKADGLAAGKGVVIAHTRAEALDAVEACFDGAFGAAGATVVMEDFLVGEEASLFVLTDGETVLPLATAQDHKRVGDGDTGPNTGGMGAYSPAPVMTADRVQRALNEIIRPTITAMAKAGTPYRGVLYAGLMITDEGPQLIEYNVRFGDPECQVLMLRLASDLLPALHACTSGTLDGISLDWRNDPALTVVMAADGYPATPKTGTQITGLDALNDEGVIVFHAGTRRDDDRLLAAGGRVLNVSAIGPDIAAARARAYAAIEKINWPEGFYRSDIAWRAIKRTQ